MKNISGQYQDLLEGKMSQAQFLRNARMMFPSFVTNHNSFDDSVRILKQKGMLNEGTAVKGAPDKEPTYDALTPDDKIKYKKVEQSPEVDEQDGIYPATTITDIPKTKTYKKVKNTSDGLEPIKDNDTKNEMKKVKVVKESVEKDIEKAIKDKKIDPAKVKAAAEKAMNGDSTDLAVLMAFGGKVNPMEENQRSFDDIFADFIETDDSTEIKAYIKSKGKEAISKIKAELPKTPDRIRRVLAKLMKVELDEVKTNKTSFDYKSTFEDLVIKTNTASKSDFGSIKQNWIERVENSKINPDTKKQMLNSIKAINSLLDLQKFASYGLLRYEKMAVRENQVNEITTDQMPSDTVSLLSILKRIESQTKSKFFAISNADELKDVFDYILDRVNPTLSSSATQLRTALNQAVQSNLDDKKNKKVAPKLESLITKVMNETLSKKSAK